MTQGFFFLVFVVIIALLLLQWLLSAARRQDLGPRSAQGTRVAAVVSGIAPSDEHASVADADSSPHWYIDCKWTEPRSGTVYTFRSAAVDDATARAYIVGAPIGVLMLPGTPDSYFVEVVEP